MGWPAGYILTVKGLRKSGATGDYLVGNAIPPVFKVGNLLCTLSDIIPGPHHVFQGLGNIHQVGCTSLKKVKEFFFPRS